MSFSPSGAGRRIGEHVPQFRLKPFQQSGSVGGFESTQDNLVNRKVDAAHFSSITAHDPAGSARWCLQVRILRGPHLVNQLTALRVHSIEHVGDDPYVGWGNSPDSQRRNVS